MNEYESSLMLLLILAIFGLLALPFLVFIRRRNKQKQAETDTTEPCVIYNHYVYVVEKELLPDHYVPVAEPSFSGRGNHSVTQLEEMCEGYKELVHQLRVREQTLLYKFDAVIVKEMPDCESVGKKHIVDISDPDAWVCSECHKNLQYMKQKMEAEDL